MRARHILIPCLRLASLSKASTPSVWLSDAVHFRLSGSQWQFLPLSDWLFPRRAATAAYAGRGGWWEDGGQQQQRQRAGRCLQAPRAAGGLRVARQVPGGAEAARREGGAGLGLRRAGAAAASGPPPPGGRPGAAGGAAARVCRPGAGPERAGPGPSPGPGPDSGAQRPPRWWAALERPRGCWLRLLGGREQGWRAASVPPAAAGSPPGLPSVLALVPRSGRFSVPFLSVPPRCGGARAEAGSRRREAQLALGLVNLAAPTLRFVS